MSCSNTFFILTTVMNSVLEKNHVKVWQCSPAQSSKLLDELQKLVGYETLCREKNASRHHQHLAGRRRLACSPLQVYA